MTDAVAKFPGTAGTSQLAQSDVGGEIVGIGEAEWTLATQILSGTVAPLSIVVNETVSARVPTTGWLILDSEIFHFNALNTGTKTFTADARSQQDTTAGQHDVGTWVGFTVTKRWYNQIVADTISMQTQMLSGIHNPNLVLNSDFSRRTVLGLAMPEVFADLSGTTKIDGGAAGSVAANIFTQGAANNEYAWCAGSFVWRDGRASATFKATATAGIYELRWRLNATNYVSAKQNNGNFTLVYNVGGGNVVLATVAQALTLNNWYWLEVEAQGTTFIVKLYNTTVTTPGTLKSASTLLQTLSGPIAAFNGVHISITSDQAAAQWGGIASGNGGVYVETWLPESWAISHSGTLGGQAIGFDESADSGPNVSGAPYKQWAMRAYIPAITRGILISQTTPDGSLGPSTTYAGSGYLKVSGLGGSGSLVAYQYVSLTSASANVTVATSLGDGGATSWTRKSTTFDSGATARRGQLIVQINPPSTATGTAYFMLPQLEQGSTVTAWRNAPADDAGGAYDIALSLDKTTTSAAFVDLDSRDMAGNFFLPYDATVLITFYCNTVNTGANTIQLAFSVDGVDTTALAHYAGGTVSGQIRAELSQLLAAGKHRIAVRWKTSAGTATMSGAGAAIGLFRVAWTRGK